MVDVHIGHLRRKLAEDPGHYLDTVHGVRWRMTVR